MRWPCSSPSHNHMLHHLHGTRTQHTERRIPHAHMHARADKGSMVPQKSISRLLRVLLTVPLFIGFFASPSANTNHTVHQARPRRAFLC